MQGYEEGTVEAEMTAFDKLPPELRSFLASCPRQFCAEEILEGLEVWGMLPHEAIARCRDIMRAQHIEERFIPK